MTRLTDAATLRDLAKAAGTTLRVRKGKGCRKGALHVYMPIDSTREDRIAAVAFLASVNAECVLGYERIDFTTYRAEFFDSLTVNAFEV